MDVFDINQLYEALTVLLQFIVKNSWAIILVIALLKYRRTSGIVLCVLQILWNLFPINNKVYIFLVIAISFGAIFEHDYPENTFYNILLPFGSKGLKNNDDE